MLRSAVPVFVENDDPVYSLGMSGTGFLVTLDGRLLLLTTKHGLMRRAGPDARLPKVMVPRCFSSPDMWTPVDAFIPEAGDADDDEIADFLVIALGREWTTCDCEDCPRPYDLDSHRLPDEVPNDVRVLARGFPDALNGVDFDKRHIPLRAADLRGQFLGVTSRDGVLSIRFEGQLPPFPGLSGSPVFLDLPGMPLLGMLNRGSKENNHAYCLNSGNLLIGIRRAVAGDLVEQLENAHNRFNHSCCARR